MSIPIGRGCCGVVRGPTLMQSLIPIIGKNTIGLRGAPLWKTWFLSLSFTQKLSLVMTLVDIASDILFTIDIKNTHYSLSHIALISLILSIFSFGTCIFLDLAFFAAIPKDTRGRRLIRLRWGVLVTFPI